MAWKQFLAFLTNDQGKSLDVENEVVVTRARPDALDDDPDGWEDSVLQYARNNEFRGIIKSYTTSLKFVLEGAKILRNSFYKIGVEAVLYFIWQKQNLEFDAGMRHQGWYKGEPDFQTFRDGYDSVEINITEGGFYRQLQSNKGVPYEIEMDDPRSVSIYHDGMILDQRLNYADLTLEVALNQYGTNFLGPVLFLNQEGEHSGVLNQTQELETAPAAYGDKLISPNIILRNLSDVTLNVTIAGVIEFDCTAMVSSPPWALRFRFIRSTLPIGNQNDYQIYSTVSGMVLGQRYSQAYSITIPLIPNETLLREGIFFGGVGANAAITFTDNSKFNITFETIFKPTIIEAFRAIDIGDILTNKMSDGQCSLSGSLLSNDYNLLITSGDAIRGLDDVVMETKFTDWHKSIDAVKCVALEIVNNNPVIQSRYDKFTDTTIKNLGECVWEPLEVATEYIYDTVEVGFPNQESGTYDNINGRYEVNTTVIWKCPITRVKNKYDAVSVYRADPTGIEALRINLESKISTDNKSDRNLFFMDCEKMYSDYVGNIIITAAPNKMVITGTGLNLLPKTKFRILSGLNTGYFSVLSASETGGTTVILVNETVVAETISTTLEWRHYKLRRRAYTSITGIPHASSWYNIELSPKTIFKNHYRWIRSANYKADTKSLIFQVQDKNSALSRTIGGETITERENIPIFSMGDRVYLPVYFNIQAESPHNLHSLMNANSSGHFDFTFGRVALQGFPIDIKTNEASLETQNYKLLATANCDLLQLINNR